jgi:hypothetical protein
VAQDTAKPTSNVGDDSAQLRKYSLGSVSSNHSHSNNSAAGNVQALADSMFISTNVDESPAHRPRSATLDPKSPSLSSSYNSFSFPVAVNPNRSGSKDFGGVEGSGTPSLPGANVNAIDPTRASSYSVLNPPASSSSSSGSTSGRRHLPPSVKTLLRGRRLCDSTIQLRLMNICLFGTGADLAEEIQRRKSALSGKVGGSSNSNLASLSGKANTPPLGAATVDEPTGRQSFVGGSSSSSSSSANNASAAFPRSYTWTT